MSMLHECSGSAGGGCRGAWGDVEWRACACRVELGRQLGTVHANVPSVCMSWVGLWGYGTATNRQSSMSRSC